MHIILWVDEVGKVIDVMPFRDVMLESIRRTKAKGHCSVCQQPKHYICLKRHNYKKTAFENFLNDRQSESDITQEKSMST